jgi:hypothetical protein
MINEWLVNCMIMPSFPGFSRLWAVSRRYGVTCLKEQVLGFQTALQDGVLSGTHVQQEIFMKHILPVIALAAASSLAIPALAQSGGGTTYQTTATGPAEQPPNNSPGTSTVMIDISGSNLMVEAPFRDLVGTTIDAHLHCCTTAPSSGVAPVAMPFVGFPVGVRSGTYANTIPLDDVMSYDPFFLAAHGGTPQGAASALLDAMNAGEAYVNIHTSAYPNGEIRGFVMAAPIPEPAQWSMLAGGLGGLLLIGRRLRRERVRGR